MEELEFHAIAIAGVVVGHGGASVLALAVYIHDSATLLPGIPVPHGPKTLGQNTSTVHRRTTHMRVHDILHRSAAGRCATRGMSHQAT